MQWDEVLSSVKLVCSSLYSDHASWPFKSVLLLVKYRVVRELVMFKEFRKLTLCVETGGTEHSGASLRGKH